MLSIETLRQGRSTWTLVSGEPALRNIIASWDQKCSSFEEVHARAGRGPVTAIPLSDVRRGILRHLRHGGLLGGLLGDVFAGSSRTLKEFFLLLRARERGAPVPKVLAASTERFYGLFYRGDLVTEEVVAKTLAEYLTEGSPENLKDLLRLLLTLHRSGVEHVDLNIHNILVPQDGSAWVAIDLDRAKLHEVLPLGKRVESLFRLDRSYEKHFGPEGPLHPIRRYRIWHHYLKNIGIEPRRLLPLVRKEKANRYRHRLWWSLGQYS